MEKTRSVKNSLWSARNKMGFSQKRVACALGLRRTCELSRYEHGTRIPGLINALKMEIVYRTPVAFLYSDLYIELKGKIREKEEQINHGKGK
jgi:transcriptional regulator with XRE-family HTH domain